ncbi:MAG TPA: lipopolysaccharide heptosyltransferase I [Burkholderiales bacterium]|nr:lipopolysaccharide heptosyltransferase I [Burkholderiales bacterium]
MQRVLFIKLTSLGDLIHALPALSDAQNARPDIEFDWVVDENFREIAAWHPAVKNIITTNHREWRGAVTSAETHGSISKTIGQMRSRQYDLVIDGQGNFKTALLSLLSKGPRAGFDAASVREWVAHLAYQRRYAASKNAHAIERLRRLLAAALGYPLPSSAPDFRIQRERFLKPRVELPADYLVFIHNASWKTKLWPERHWIDLIGKCAGAGFRILLPWGNAQEEARAKRLATRPEAQVLPRLSLSEIGHVLARARACVCMDTGLSHLTAALDVPAITLYGSTDSGLIGASGALQVHIKSERFCSPCQSKTCRYSSGDNPCLEEIGPDRVFGELLRLTGPAIRPIPASPVSASARRAS